MCEVSAFAMCGERKDNVFLVLEHVRKACFVSYG